MASQMHITSQVWVCVPAAWTGSSLAGCRHLTASNREDASPSDGGFNSSRAAPHRVKYLSEYCCFQFSISPPHKFPGFLCISFQAVSFLEESIHITIFLLSQRNYSDLSPNVTFHENKNIVSLNLNLKKELLFSTLIFLFLHNSTVRAPLPQQRVEYFSFSFRGHLCPLTGLRFPFQGKINHIFRLLAQM